MLNYQEIIETIASDLKGVKDKGTVASYIPELSKIDPNKFGIHLVDAHMNRFSAGDAEELFSIQSISKVLSLAKCFALVGDSIWQRINVEPSGDPFNHLALLEFENGIPRNPLINAGAIVVADILVSNLENPKAQFLDFIRQITNDDSIAFNEKVADSEKKTGYHNIAAANLLKSYGNLKNDVDEVLDFYFHQCAIEMNCRQLANAFYLFMNHGKCQSGKTHLNINQVKRINALMLTCGFYDEAGDFAFEVGLPGKSGVGGGIAAVLPDKFAVVTWSPGLNRKGNSKLGMQALEKLTTKTSQSIF
ncbi:glutaminase [Maribacter polysiphoniae]|uniref:Glutaminase n=1 Tax=Maribacter polysiphoniae TaxID=429344 RepID=A0A316E4E2_9FLAO|nr:glutaminase [Maribacter polysiphoniae]MBD1260622.1 glutaminase [Maribacter polysiphoniae]PWK24249.1 L-glutaminase [Maribacter polysiphoniae]